MRRKDGALTKIEALAYETRKYIANCRATGLDKDPEIADCIKELEANLKWAIEAGALPSDPPADSPPHS